MLRTRIIPALLLHDEALVKTIKFSSPSYIGDPINTVRIFNELEVDELVFLDISATPESRTPDISLLKEIANECFMPLAYGGGLNDFEKVKEIFTIGYEKVILNSITHQNPGFITRVAQHYGSQAVVVSIDVKKNLFGKYLVYTQCGKKNTGKNPVAWAMEAEKLGAGEILLTSIDKEGTWSGFDVELIRQVSNAVNIPVIAHGGAGNLDHIRQAVINGKASAVALGSMVVYQKKNLGVLVNFPERNLLHEKLIP